MSPNNYYSYFLLFNEESLSAEIDMLVIERRFLPLKLVSLKMKLQAEVRLANRSIAWSNLTCIKLPEVPSHNLGKESLH